MQQRIIGLDGTELKAGIDGNKAMMARIESIRREAGVMMGFGDVADKVIPKVGILSAPRNGGTITSRYLTPLALHAAHAVTGGVCVASACALEGSVAHAVATPSGENPRTIWIEHPSGQIDVRLTTTGIGAKMDIVAGTLRTARPIMRGEVLVPKRLLVDRRLAKPGTATTHRHRNRSDTSPRWRAHRRPASARARRRPRPA